MKLGARGRKNNKGHCKAARQKHRKGHKEALSSVVAVLRQQHEAK